MSRLPTPKSARSNRPGPKQDLTPLSDRIRPAKASKVEVARPAWMSWWQRWQTTSTKVAELIRKRIREIGSRWRKLPPGRIAVIVLAQPRCDQRWLTAGMLRGPAHSCQHPAKPATPAREFRVKTSQNTLAA